MYCRENESSIFYINKMQLFVKTYDILRQLRWHQWYKALLVFSVLLFLQHQSVGSFSLVLAGAIAFALSSSIVYIINDLGDIERDRQHPVKKLRPLASGVLTPFEVASLMVLLSGLVLVLVGLLANVQFTALLFGYVLLNLLYTYYIKHIPYVDIVFVALFAGIRAASGFFLLGVAVNWFLVGAVMALFLFILTVQRLAEVAVNNVAARPVIKKYSPRTLKFLMTFFMMVSVIFYFLAMSVVALPLVYTDVLYFLVLLVVHEYMCFAENRKDIAEDGFAFFLHHRLGLVLFLLLLLSLLVAGVALFSGLAR